MSDTILLSEDSPDTQLCMACLCVGRSLHEINQEKLKQYYLQALNEIQLCYNATCPLVCWECKAKLVKSVLFREQVKDSYRILQTYTRENLQECLVTDIIRQPQLRIQVLEPIALGNDDGAAQGDTKPELVYLKNEIKVEWDKDVTDALADNGNMSECSQDMSEDQDSRSHVQKLVVKKKIKKKKRVDRVRKTSRVNKELKIEKNKNASKDQKILTIELSYEEMLQEREKDALKESYVKSEYRCELCLLGFSYNNSYKAHMAAKHDSALGDYSCPICKTILLSVESFTAHYKRHLRRYECSVCAKRTGDTKSMQAHFYTAHEVALRQYTCGHCGLVSNSIDSHRYHCDTHKARVQCSQCDKTFRHRAGLMNHRLAVHEFKNEFACSMCDKVFRWKTSLKRHLEKHDTKAKASSPAAYCVTCGVSFSSLCSYRRHLHTSLKHVSQSQLKFICDHCKKRFADKTKLRDHIEEKHLHKTYQCPVCMKPSKNRVGLDQHMRNVHKGRPNNKICHHCGKAFPTKVQLESHIRTHTGERPFICEYCPTTFSQQSNLYKHNRQVHLNIKSKRYPHCKKREIKNNTPQLELQTAQDFEVPVLRYSPERGFVM